MYDKILHLRAVRHAQPRRRNALQALSGRLD